RGIEHFFHRRAEAMDLVDEQHVALFEIGEQCGKIAGFRNHRTGSGAKADAEFARDDLRQRGLAEAGGPYEQHMVQRLVTLARGFDEDGEIGARLRLADKFGQQLRAQRGIADIVAAALGGDDAGGRVHATLAKRRVMRQQMIDAISDPKNTNGNACTTKTGRCCNEGGGPFSGISIASAGSTTEESKAVRTGINTELCRKPIAAPAVTIPA